jgi:hypothetical protein
MRSYEFRKGYDGYLDGLKLDDNPYSSDEAEWEEWREGWYAAGEDD